MVIVGLMRVLIGPCGIETEQMAGITSVYAVLIGPCGIETLLMVLLRRVFFVLIGPCGIETRKKNSWNKHGNSINWTLRN